ncbi:E3 ubiquitin-protein ligase MARCHF1-like isoform X2 [Plodia interpunctella]|uniref:E3 ubiquitin-protein ligase MARCHF1-like isoform X2 n=1 Tax=Plodia interpunctella TaxID=58824 RepID=UPI0023682BAD|nr:E3 ubiquitin-protein ligase MARCHF1-like isoform X2 [Plodia interpunctella]
MDEDKVTEEPNGEETKSVETRGEKDVKVNEETTEKHTDQDDAGPSRAVPLPGFIPNNPNPTIPITAKSKSEHNIRQIFTRIDVANALKTISFHSSQGNKTFIMNEITIPIDKDNTEKDDVTTFVELKKFMATFFKFNKDLPATVLTETPTIVNVQPIVTPEVPNSSCNVQTESIINVANEVIVTNIAPIDAKLLKVSSESNKKKVSGSVSERSEYGLAQRDSLSSIGSNVCRICMTRGRERLISPCNCKGSLANVHLSCLERWLNQVGRNHCELCGFSYPAIRTPRYTVLQALRLWFGNPRNRSHLQSDCLIFWLLSTVTAGLLAVCIVGTQYFVIEGNKFGISHRITETAMDFFMAIVLCGYSVTVYLLWKDHYVMWNRWRRANVNVRLLLSPDANPVPFVPRARYNVV